MYTTGAQCAQARNVYMAARQRGSGAKDRGPQLWGQTHVLAACCRCCRACTLWSYLQGCLGPAPTGLHLGRRRCPRSCHHRHRRHRRRRSSPLAQLQKLVEQQGGQALRQQLPLKQRQLQKLEVAARARWGVGGGGRGRDRVRRCLMPLGGQCSFSKCSERRRQA